MTHSLYGLTYEPGNTVYQLVRQIRLTAKSGTKASFVREKRGQEPGGWYMNELISWLGLAVILTLKPSWLT